MTEKTEQAEKVVQLKKSKCPNCDKPVSAQYNPFCSERCANLDLGRWLNGEYRIATDEAPGNGGFAEEDDG